MSLELRTVIFIDETNTRFSARDCGYKVDWVKLREFLAREDQQRRLLDCVIFYGMAPNTEYFQECRERQQRFIHCMTEKGFRVVIKEGTEHGNCSHSQYQTTFKANVDVLMAIDGLDYVYTAKPDIVILVTGDADFVRFADVVRRHGIRVEVASVRSAVSAELSTIANEFIDLEPLFKTFPVLSTAHE